MYIDPTIRVICGFPGVGKSHLFNDLSKQNFPIVDSDSSQFDKSQFPANYIAHIQSKIAEGYWVLCSTHATVRAALKEAGIKYILVIPYVKNKEEYMRRYTQRGSSADFLRLMRDQWNVFTHDVWSDDYGVIYALQKNQYLSKIIPYIVPIPISAQIKLLTETSDEELQLIAKDQPETIRIVAHAARKLIEALAPFAEKSEKWMANHPPGRYGVRDGHQITHRLGDFRACEELFKTFKETQTQ